MKRRALAGSLLLVFTASAASASADPQPSMPGMAMPAEPDTPAQPNTAAMSPDASEIPDTPPPPTPTDHAADRFYDPAAMTAARRSLREEHGGATFSKVIANLAEYQARSGDGYRWDAQAWYGGDIDRLVIKSEGEGSGREGVEAAEAQALYSRAVGPYFDFQAGLRQDFRPTARTYLTAGVEGVLPYWFEVNAAVFLSTRGELLARFEGTYDLRLTQRLILQPRAELNFAAQDTLETRTGAGLSNAELGLRLRYEIRREFAPYVGVSFDRKLGRTADYARLRGEGAGGASFVAGIRTWF